MISIPYTFFARSLNPRKTLSAYLLYAIPTAISYIYLLLILTIPFSWLIHYITDMGSTANRINAVFYGIGLYIFILLSLFLLLRKPRDLKKKEIPSSEISESSHENVILSGSQIAAK